MNSLISSLAILKVEWDSGRDYIQSFLPFVLESLKATDKPYISLGEVQEFISNEFGLRIPQGALKTILQRAVKCGYVIRKEGVYHKNDEKLSEINITKKRADIERQQKALVDKLVLYVDNEHSVEWNEKQAETQLLSFLRKETVPILEGAIKGDPISLNTEHDSRAEYLVASFIKNIEDRDPEAFQFLETITKGTMLSNVLFFPSLGKVKQRFVDAKIVFDTPVVLKVLGLTVKDERVAYEEMLDLLYELNANIYFFEHSLRELRGILNAASHALSNPQYQRGSQADAIEYFIRNGYSSSDVEFILARLEHYLRNHHIRILPNPSFEASTTIDEEKLGELLMDRVGYNQEKTMQHDLRAISSIFTLRDGSFPQNIESCKAIFVTSNTPLVRTTVDFFCKEYGEQASMVPLLLPYHTISTLAWLKKPMAAPDLPENIVSATCYAALNPPDMLWRMYLEEVEELSNGQRITDEDYYLLRFSSEARTLLMDKTLGNYEAYAEGTVIEILEHTKENIRSGLREKFESERVERLRAEEDARQLKSKLEHRIRRVSLKIAKIISRSIGIFLLVALLFGLVYSFPGVSKLIDSPLALIPFMLLLIFFILSLCNAIWGTKLISIIRSIENNIDDWLHKFLLRLLTGENQ